MTHIPPEAFFVGALAYTYVAGVKLLIASQKSCPPDSNIRFRWISFVAGVAASTILLFLLEAK